MRNGLECAKWLAVLLAGVAWFAADAAPPTTHSGLDPEVDKILTRLEKREVHDLRAKLMWRLHYTIDLPEDDTIKHGHIWYKDTEPVAKFLIHFSKKVVGGALREIDERHLFDGQWYVEIQGRTKTYKKYEVRKSDDPADPYKVGQGVFPMPFGQKKADILAEFEVERIATVEGDPTNTDHIRLIPREASRTGEKYKSLDFWVAREGPAAGLPIRVQVARKSGTGRVDSHVTIEFREIQLNTGYSNSVFQIKPPSGYEVVVERLKPAALPPAGKEQQSDSSEGNQPQ